MTITSINSIQRGIVFLMATWSGGAVSAHRHLTSFLEQHGIPKQQLHVLDVDHHPELYDMPEFAGKIHGWGEAAIVKDGKIVYVTVLGKDQNQIQNHCHELLRVYSA